MQPPFRKGLLSTLLAIGLSAPMWAATVELQTVAFSSNSLLTTSTFASFDPNKGVLDRVTIEISAVTTAFILTATNLRPNPVPLRPPIGAPYVAIARIGHDLGGAIDASPQPSFLFTILASGQGEIIPVPVPFAYEFSFTAASDRVGSVSAVPSSPLAVGAGTIFGSRDRFTGAPGMLSAFLTALPGNDSRLQPAGATTVGTLRVTYAYTPHQEPPVTTPPPLVPPTVVPLPLAFPLTVAAFLSLALLRRRRPGEA